MHSSPSKTIKVAILDMYEGATNQGMRCIKELLNQYADVEQLNIDYNTYDVRLKEELPNLTYDLYISTGGPGSPIDSTNTSWENKFNKFIATIINHNLTNHRKKHLLFICHSFQLACKYRSEERRVGKEC